VDLRSLLIFVMASLVTVSNASAGGLDGSVLLIKWACT